MLPGRPLVRMGGSSRSIVLLFRRSGKVRELQGIRVRRTYRLGFPGLILLSPAPNAYTLRPASNGEASPDRYPLPIPPTETRRIPSRGPPKGFKLKRKRSHGVEADASSSRRSEDPRSRDPQTPRPLIDGPRNRGSPSHGRRSSESSSSSGSPPPQPPPSNPEDVPDGRMDAAGTSVQRAQETGHAHGRVSGSPDVGFAVSALESLSDERYYQPRPPSTAAAAASPIVERRDDVPDEINVPLSPRHDQHTTATQQPPPPQSLSRPGLPAIIHSVPTSSRNSEDGMAETRGEEGPGRGDGSAGRVHVDRHTQDRLLAIYWTHIHVRSA